MKQKIVKLKFVNWTSKSERILDLKMLNEQNFVTFTYFLMDFHLVWYKSDQIEQTFKAYD